MENLDVLIGLLALRELEINALKKQVMELSEAILILEEENVRYYNALIQLKKKAKLESQARKRVPMGYKRKGKDEKEKI